MSFYKEIKKLTQSYANVLFLWIALLQLLVLADSLDKEFNSPRLPRTSSFHELDASPHAIKSVDKLKKTTNKTGRYEIRTVSGEPNYKSVNLSWEVEFVPSPITPPFSISFNDTTITNSSSEVEPPITFQIFYCEIKPFGPQRCRSKSVNSSQQLTDQRENKQVRHYTVQIGNLRMATKYSFHIRPQQDRKSSLQITGRSEIFNNEVDDGTIGLSSGGQTIFIPTKGFSAQATKCLPQASEIEVETGPYFGGKIIVDDSNCGIKGNPDDPVEKYTMRIDHKLCGSLVKPETNTVETFITVQENLGIFTYSTRRFVVVCSFQSGMQTVRASFTVPGKEGVGAAVQNDPFEPDERTAREDRQIRFVNKSALVMKEQSTSKQTAAEDSSISAKEVQKPALDFVEGSQQAKDAKAILEDFIPEVNERHIGGANELQMENGEQMDTMKPVAHARLAKLFAEQNEPKHFFDDETFTLQSNSKINKSELHQFATNVSSVILTISLSVIIIGVCVYVVLKETRRRAFININSMRGQQEQPHEKTTVHQKQQQ